MSLSLHSVQPNKKARKSKKRVGRGNSSGHGTYSTRGLKGQKARAGASGSRRRGLQQLLRNLPKFKGQKRRRPGLEVINIGQIDKHFRDGDTINIKKLVQKNLIETSANGLKVLSEGMITKKVTVVADGFSLKAKEMIEKAGGKTIVVGRKK